MHLAERMQLPEPYVARPYRGPDDHPAMTAVLAAYREHIGDPEMATLDQMNASYALLTDCDPTNDIVVIETTDGNAVAYARAIRSDLLTGIRDCIVFNPIHPEHLAAPHPGRRQQNKGPIGVVRLSGRKELPQLV